MFYIISYICLKKTNPMKLESILDKLGSLEKNSFIKILDNIIANNPKNSKEIDKILNTGDRSIKSIDNQNISKIFELSKTEFFEILIQEFQNTDSQLDILIDIIIREGNCIMSLVWFSKLYEKEVTKLQNKIKVMNNELTSDKSEISEIRKRDYKIYKACLKEAYHNDEINNRDKKITSDELSILLTLSKELELSQEEVKLINYSILPINVEKIEVVINNLKNIGVLFFSKKDNTIYIPDEIVRILRELRGKEIADKFYRRTLKLLREPIINQISKRHGIERSLSNDEKIEEIIKEGISFKTLLLNEIYKEDSNLNERKKELNELCEKGLEIQNLKGKTLEEKADSLIEYFENIEKDEKVGISKDGYEKLLLDLENTLEGINKLLKSKYELEEENVLNADFLLNYNIKPRDILDFISKQDLNSFIKENGVKQRGDNVLNILEHYKDTENLYIENFVNIAFRDLNKLKENSIQIKESELGLKFEELTKVIFTKLGFFIDEKLKTKVNTSKDKIDVLINLGEDEVIIVECKTSKESGYNKFSSVSRQLKSYQSLIQKNNLKVNKILLVAPEFTDDFISECELDTELNLTLISASTLLNIVNTFKNSKFEKFPHVLFRDVVINEERVLKALLK